MRCGIGRPVGVDDRPDVTLRLHVQDQQLGAAVAREAGRVLHREIRGRRGVGSHQDRRHRGPPSFVTATLRRAARCPTTARACGVRAGASTPRAGCSRTGNRRSPPLDARPAGGTMRWSWAESAPLRGCRGSWRGADPRHRGRRPRVPDPAVGRRRSLRPRSRSAGTGCRCRSSSRRPVYWSPRRVPANPIGWLLLAAGAGTAIQELAQQYAIYGLLDSPGAVPGADIAAWIPEWIGIPFMAAIALYIPLFYPDGHLPSRRWVWVAVLGGLAGGGRHGLLRTHARTARRVPRAAEPVRCRGCRLDPEGRRCRDALPPGRRSSAPSPRWSCGSGDRRATSDSS